MEYMYAFAGKRNDMAVLIIRFENADDAIRPLEHSEVNMVSSVDICSQARERREPGLILRALISAQRNGSSMPAQSQQCVFCRLPDRARTRAQSAAMFARSHAA